MARRRYNRNYRFTPRRKAALKKAQAISAKKRHLGGRGIKKRHVAMGAGVLGVAIAGGVVANHKIRGHQFGITTGENKSMVTGKQHGLLRHNNGPTGRQIHVGVGKRRVTFTHDTRGRSARIIAQHRATVAGKQLSKKRKEWKTPLDDNRPDSSTRRIVATTTSAGSAPSRVVGDKFPEEIYGSTYTGVRHGEARRIMREGKRAVFGVRPR